MRKKLLGITLALTLALGLTGCGSSNDSSNDTASEPAAVETASEEASEESEPDTEVSENATLANAGEDASETDSTFVYTGDPVTIKVGANITPHAEILREAQPILAEQGITLEIVELEDSVTPNTGVIEGSLDANYFQHVPYLDQFNEENGSDLVSIGAIHYEPFGVYAGKTTSLADLPDGATVAVPNNVTNEARALLLLQDNGIITLKDGAGLTATVNDIETYNVQIKIIELAAESVKDAIPDAAYVILNGNYALEAGLSVGQDALAYESNDSAAAQTYVNVIAVKEGHENDEGIVALVNVLKSDEIKQFIIDTYDGAVVPFD